MQNDRHTRTTWTMLNFGDPDTEEQSGKMKSVLSFMKSLRKDNSGVALLKDQGKMHADTIESLNSVSSQCARSKSLMARKPGVHPKKF